MKRLMEERKMELIEKIEKQTEKHMELRQEIDGIVDALNDMPCWEQSIDDAKARAKEVQRKFRSDYEVNKFPLTDDELQEVFDENEQVLYELEEIKDFLNSWLEFDDEN